MTGMETVTKVRILNELANRRAEKLKDIIRKIQKLEDDFGHIFIMNYVKLTNKIFNFFN